MSHHQSVGHGVQRMVSLVWLILAVCAGTKFISVKMSFAASTTLCGATRCATALDQVQQSLWGSRTSHPLDFNGGMTRRIISTLSTFRLAEPAIAMWARKRAPRVKSSAPYCSVVVGTPDVHRWSVKCWRKTWRLQGETTKPDVPTWTNSTSYWWKAQNQGKELNRSTVTQL